VIIFAKRQVLHNNLLSRMHFMCGFEHTHTQHVTEILFVVCLAFFQVILPVFVACYWYISQVYSACLWDIFAGVLSMFVRYFACTLGMFLGYFAGALSMFLRYFAYKLRICVWRVSCEFLEFYLPSVNLVLW